MSLINNIKLAGAALASATLLAACHIPEKFTSSVDVRPDGSYQFLYSGTTINALAAESMSRKPLTSSDEASLTKEATELVAQKSYIKKATYKGNARFAVEIDYQGKPGQKMTMFELFKVYPESKDGTIIIGVGKLAPGDVAELKKIGVAIDGKLSVNVPKGATVISHNATSTPTFGFGSYGWKIGAVDQAPYIKMKLAQQ